MTTRAVCDVNRLSSCHVFFERNRFQVGRIAAESDSTQMVDRETFGDRTNQKLIRGSMSLLHPAFKME